MSEDAARLCPHGRAGLQAEKVEIKNNIWIFRISFLLLLGN